MDKRKSHLIILGILLGFLVVFGMGYMLGSENLANINQDNGDKKSRR